MIPKLETERLILKQGTKEDFIKVYEYDFTKLRDINNEFEYVKNDLNVISSFSNYALEEDVYDWIVYLKESLEPIANVIADREVKDIKAIELSFNLHPLYWGNGYVKEAVVEIMDYLFNNGYDNIICGYSEGNVKSKRVNEKIGFEPYYIISNAWIKDGIGVNEYKTIMTKTRYNELYKSLIK